MTGKEEKGLMISRDLKNFFFPDRVVVFGVSQNPSNLAGIIPRNNDNYGFTGEIYLVGQSGGSMGNRQIYRSVEEIGVVPDLAVLLIPADSISSTMTACGKMGIKSVVIETGGFSEFDDEKRFLEAEIIRTAGEWGMTVMGPNCIGVINIETGLTLPFVPLDKRQGHAGSVSMISQSGGIIRDILKRSDLENLALNKVVSIGNKLMLNENDILEYLIGDPGTRIIGIYLESFGDGRELVRLAGSTDKPVIVLKANRAGPGSKAARFHTSALAGNDEVADAILRQSGILRALTTEVMINWFKIFTLPAMCGPNLIAMARSGGQCVLIADAAARYGLKFVDLPERISGMLRKHLRAGVIRLSNPLDVGDIFDIGLYKEMIELSLSEPGVDGLIFYHEFENGPGESWARQLIHSARELTEQYKKPVVLCMIPERENYFEMKDVEPFPIFTDADSAAQALAVSLRHFVRTSGEEPVKAQPRTSRAAGAGTGRERMRPGDHGSPLVPVITDVRATLELLARYNLPLPGYALVRTVEEGAEAARRIGYPVALKTASPYVVHKSEQNAVHIGLADEDALRRAFDRMQADEYLVQRMVPGGYETIVGCRRDPEFGQVIIFGMGGIFTEVLRDTSMRLLPIELPDARKMISEIRGSRLLQGFRGSGPVDVDAIASCLVAVSRLLQKHPEITALDINPLIALPVGQGCMIVDAKMERETQEITY
ncbi:MAG: succinyl-CoA synthetase subunit alpha [Syntrophorhabdus sp. PtaU1.Bin058]|nr:MAG: succinyl-CoA synthetase subunit alpha [Syntrophorhabdus sp. PtaU1.Bin058]